MIKCINCFRIYQIAFNANEKLRSEVIMNSVVINRMPVHTTVCPKKRKPPNFGQ